MYYSFDVINTSFLYEIIDGALMFSVVLFGSCRREVEGLWPDKNWFMLSLKFPRQKIVKGDFLKRDGDFRACIRGYVSVILNIIFFIILQHQTR